ncbi:MAG: cysteine hydrolase [Gammaproteobacteria bacterium]|nr:cysteine hydrolase [Gammaproteobacteria bacterium]MYE86263.1 cysteine hydrolase [Gammaproteobacteria bacterium]
MNAVFWDVDTQADFMQPKGKLYVPGAETIAPNLAQLTDYAHARGIRIIASADDHSEDHEEISATPDFTRTFPPHCLRGSAGQRRIPETALRDPLVIEPDGPLPNLAGHSGDILFHKHHFDVFTNPHVSPVIEALGVEDVTLYGVALDVCNRYAVEGLRRHHPKITLRVVADAVQALNPAKGAQLLDAWGRQGVIVTSTANVVQ